MKSGREKDVEVMENVLQDIAWEKLTGIVLSGRKAGDADKLKVRPVRLKGQICYQVTRYVGTQVFHENFEKDDLIPILLHHIKDNFKQCQIETQTLRTSILVSKKGKVTISNKKKKAEEIVQILPKSLEHNRKKTYLLPEGEVVPFLVDLGVMTKEGKIVHAKYDKYRQINRFLEFVEDILPKLDKTREQTIIDFGCGKSYLTFAMYYYLHQVKGYDVRMIGLDLKADVIRHCNTLRDKYGYEKLEFLKGDIAGYDGVEHVDMVVSLHACDTATDYALQKAVMWGSKVILSVPCCQHEVNHQIKNELLSPILKYGILKERMSALITDGIRANLLEQAGYQVQILEFIQMEHTPKNLLIRAVYTGKTAKQKNIIQKNEHQNMQSAELDRLIEQMHLQPTLQQLLMEEEK